MGVAIQMDSLQVETKRQGHEATFKSEFYDCMKLVNKSKREIQRLSKCNVFNLQ